MNYLDIFGRKVQKCLEGDLLQSNIFTKDSTGSYLSNYNPIGNRMALQSVGIQPINRQEFDPGLSDPTQSMSFTGPGYQKVEVQPEPLPEGIDLKLGGKTTQFGGGAGAKVPWEMIGDVASAGLDAVDQATMGDKNFNAESQALDAAADGAAKMASKFGPWGLLAAGIIKTVNFGSKALGGSVEGYDVGDLGSGYASNLGHMEQQSGRLKDRLSGKTARDLKRRNEQAQLALKAKDVVDDVKFEQEARMNSVNNVIERNQLALSGGINTGLLAAKRGGKLERLNKFVTKAQYGAKLKKVEVSEEPSLLPEGELHKNKHDDFDLPVTKKGIPVITVENGAEVSTIIDLQENKDDIQQHAEIERSEVIFSKELTDYIEDARKKWHDGDDSVLLEVGKRVTKELLQNTQDNTGLIRQLKENE